VIVRDRLRDPDYRCAVGVGLSRCQMTIFAQATPEEFVSRVSGVARGASRDSARAT
jgi:hypothetical protein